MLTARFAFIAAMVLLTAVSAPAQSPTAPPPPEATAESADREAALIPLLEAYFRAEGARARRDAFAAVRDHPGVTFAEVAAALPKLNLWDEHAAGIEPITLGARSADPQAELHVRVPEGYDPAQAYPLLLGFPDEQIGTQQFCTFLASLLGAEADRFLIAAVRNLDGIWFGDSAASAAGPDNLLTLLRRRYHVDTDRVLLTGYGQGGQAAFNLALIRPDAFAAVMPLAAACVLDLGAESADVLLPNLAHLPIDAVYGDKDIETTPLPVREGQGEGTQGEVVVEGGVAGWNRYIAARAARLGVPFRTHEIPDAGRDGITPSPDLLKAFLAARRAPATAFTLCFRYPEQGRRGWLRQSRFLGDPWTAQHIVISPGENETPEEAVKAVLDEKLARIAGRVEGQTLHIETRRCERIDVLISDTLLNLDQPVTVMLDGTQRFQDTLERNLETLLDQARADWEFQHTNPARLQISRSGRAIVN